MDEKGRNRLLAVLFVGVLMGALDIAIVGPALPAIGKAFQVGPSELVWTFNIYVLFNLAATPFMAKLSDRLGRRRVYVLDVLLFAFGSAVVAFAPTFGVLLAGRALQAIGAGGIFPVASAVIGDTFPAESRGRALGIIGAVFGLAFLIGPVLGGVLLQLSWHWLFLVNIPIALTLAVVAQRLLPDTRPDHSEPFDWVGVASLTLGLGAFALGVGSLGGGEGTASLGSLRVWPFLVASAVLLSLFWRAQQRAADPVVPPRLLASRQVRLVMLFATGAGLSEAAMVFLPSLAVANLGLGESAASFMLLPLVIALGLGSPLVGRMLDQVGSKAVILVGISVTGFGLLSFGVASGTMAGFVVASALTGLGLSALLGAPLRYILLNESAAADRGASQGLLTVFMGTGQLLGGALVGAVVAMAPVGGFERALMVLAALVGAMLLPALSLKGRVQERGHGVADAHHSV